MESHLDLESRNVMNARNQNRNHILFDILEKNWNLQELESDSESHEGITKYNSCNSELIPIKESPNVIHMIPRPIPIPANSNFFQGYRIIYDSVLIPSVHYIP